MDLTQYNINVNDLPASQSFDPIPEGKYTVMVKEVELKETNDRTGRYFKFTFSVTDGQYRGRQLWTNVNWINKNKQAEDIGKQQLRTILEAAGITGMLRNTDELINAVVDVKVKIKQEEGYEPQNTINSIMPSKKGNAPQPQAQGFASPYPSSAPSPQPAKAPMPWGQK